MLSAIILYIVSRYKHGIGRTRLMKLLFLADALHRERYGRGLTGVTWYRWYFGPFSRDVLDVLDEMVAEGVLVERPDGRIAVNPLIEPPRPGLTKEAVEVLNTVINEYGFVSLEDLLEIVYERFRVRERRLGEVILG